MALVSVEAGGKVPLMMYKSLRCLQNPRKFAVFSLLCSKRKVTTKDAEALTNQPLGYINDTLRELDELKLVKFEGQSSPLTIDGRKLVREGDMEESFKCYSLTEHGLMIHSLCKSYDSDKPLANFGGTLDPKRVVESFAKLQKDELAIMLNRFRDMYLLGAALISIYYQKHESANSDWLSQCLDGRLSKDEVEKFLAEYTGPEGLVVARLPERSSIDTALMRLAELIAGKDRVTKWLSRASYSLTPEGKRIAVTLADEFYPANLGVNEEYLRPEKIEADDGILGRAIVERIAVLGTFVGISTYVWWDFLHKLRITPSDSTGIVVDGVASILAIFGWVFYVPFRIPNLLTRIAYWRRLQNERSQH